MVGELYTHHIPSYTVQGFLILYIIKGWDDQQKSLCEWLHENAQEDEGQDLYFWFLVYWREDVFRFDSILAVSWS